MGWTMTVRDDFRVIAWTRRAGNHLGLLLLLTLLSLSVQSDIALPRERRFSWRTGTNNKKVAFFVCPIQFHLLNILLALLLGFFFTFVCEDSTKETSLNLCTHINTHIHTLLIGNPPHSFSLLIIAEKHCTTAFILFFPPLFFPCWEQVILLPSDTHCCECPYTCAVSTIIPAGRGTIHPLPRVTRGALMMCVCGNVTQLMRHGQLGR